MPEAQSLDWNAENAFYLSATPTRVAKMLAQLEAFKLTINVPGAIVECGVFKGASFSRLAMFRALYCNPEAKKMVGFDTFDHYAPATGRRDVVLRSKVIADAGDRCITKDRLRTSLEARGLWRNMELVAGDIRETVPTWADAHPEARVSLLNLDVDFEPATVVALETFWPRMPRGAVLLLDDYGTFEGETRAVDEFFRGRAAIRSFPIAYSPCYLVKD